MFINPVSLRNGRILQINLLLYVDDSLLDFLHYPNNPIVEIPVFSASNSTPIKNWVFLRNVNKYIVGLLITVSAIRFS